MVLLVDSQHQISSCLMSSSSSVRQLPRGNNELVRLRGAIRVEPKQQSECWTQKLAPQPPSHPPSSVGHDHHHGATTPGSFASPVGCSQCQHDQQPGRSCGPIILRIILAPHGQDQCHASPRERQDAPRSSVRLSYAAAIKPVASSLSNIKVLCLALDVSFATHAGNKEGQQLCIQAGSTAPEPSCTCGGNLVHEQRRLAQPSNEEARRRTADAEQATSHCAASIQRRERRRR